MEKVTKTLVMISLLTFIATVVFAAPSPKVSWSRTDDGTT